MRSNNPADIVNLLSWLAVVMCMIVFMVVVGGITRLTDSGLSMVTWEPLLGTIPPISEADWAFRFEQYRAFPEFKELRPDMTMGEFKQIYFWEYLHRLLGRLLGLVYAVPLAWFWIRGRLDGRLKKLLSIGLVLGGAQGVMGWYMVKSGLVDNPYVSHYRLAAHLGLAFLVLVYLLYVFLEYFPFQKRENKSSGKAIGWAAGITAVLSIQIVWGAFVAGLNAGYIYNTFPLMQGYWIPPGWNVVKPIWMNFLDNPVSVQLVHRVLGVLLFLLAFAMWLALLHDKSVVGRKRRSQNIFVGIMVAQVLLGIFTLILHMPVALAVMHQVLACVLLGSAFVMCYLFYGKNGLADRLEINEVSRDA